MKHAKRRKLARLAQPDMADFLPSPLTRREPTLNPADLRAHLNGIAEAVNVIVGHVREMHRELSLLPADDAEAELETELGRPTMPVRRMTAREREGRRK